MSIQGSAEWLSERCGLLTASRLGDALAETRSGKPCASRENLLWELAGERLSGQSARRYVTLAMQHGSETEAEAFAAYAFERDAELQECGFYRIADLASGASPDRLVMNGGRPVGLVEAKCPTLTTHLKTLAGAPISDAYRWQVQWQLYATDLRWCDWISYRPELEPGLNLVIRHVERDEEVIKELGEKVEAFLSELDALVEKLRRVAA